MEGGGELYEPPPSDPAWLEGPEVVEMGGCCGLVCGCTSKVVYITEDSFSLPVERPCDEASDILAVTCCPRKVNRKVYVSVVSPLEV